MIKSKRREREKEDESEKEIADTYGEGKPCQTGEKREWKRERKENEMENEKEKVKVSVKSVAEYSYERDFWDFCLSEKTKK